MNKKLVALAVAGACALPLAAQAQTANVTLYGRLNMDMEVIINQKQDISTPTSLIKGNYYRVSSNSSRVGVRGDENLGGGLHAIFQVEERYDASNSSNVTMSGDTYAGLQGPWGTAKVGYYLSPYDDMAGIWGSVPTLITGILGTSAIWSNTGWEGNSQGGGAYDDRVANALEYTTPNMKGFTGNFLVAGRDTGGNDGGDITQQRAHASIYSMSGVYANGPFTLGVAYEAHNNTRAGVAGNPHLQDQAFTAAGSYQWGAVKIGAVYETMKYDIGPGGGDLKDNHYGVSMTANWGPGQLYAAWIGAANGRGSAKCVTTAAGTTCPRVGGVTLGNETGANMYEFSYTYPLSKRTLLYAGYVMIANKENAAYNFHVNQIAGDCFGNGAVCGNAARPQGVALGIVEFW